MVRSSSGRSRRRDLAKPGKAAARARPVPPGDPAAFATALIRILVDAPLRERLTTGIAEEASGRLSWHRAADEMMAVYDEVAGQSRHAVDAQP